MSAATAIDLEKTISRLAVLLTEASAGRVTLADPAGSADVELRSLGLDSSGYVVLLSSIEEQFGVRWREDEPSETFETLGTLAGHLISAGVAQ